VIETARLRGEPIGPEHDEPMSELLGLDDIVAFTLPTNDASRRVMEKLGFSYERDIEHAGMPHVLYRLHAVR
jgi:RimJ/RimL family protein N-acetyltransferase